MKKLTLALLLIAALCLFAVSPVVAAETYTIKNATAKFTFGLAGKNVVTFPLATYHPAGIKASDSSGLDGIFKLATVGNYVVVKAPWDL
jgi:hypothetical protein